MAEADQHSAVSEPSLTELLVLLILPSLKGSTQVLEAVSSHSREQPWPRIHVPDTSLSPTLCVRLSV